MFKTEWGYWRSALIGAPTGVVLFLLHEAVVPTSSGGQFWRLGVSVGLALGLSFGVVVVNNCLAKRARRVAEVRRRIFFTANHK